MPIPHRRPRVYTCVTLALAATLTFPGCVSTPEVKTASSQATAALQALRESEDSFRRAYLKEIDETIAQLKRAVIAKAVQHEVEALAEQEQTGDLIAVSRRVEALHASVRAMLDELSTIPVTSRADAKKEVAEFRATRASKSPAGAEQLETRAANPALSDSARAGLRAAAAEIRIKSQLGNDERYVRTADLDAIAELLAMKNEVDRNLKEFGDLIATLQAAHATIDDWIMTDVTVSGKEVAGLLEKHAQTLGLGGVSSGGGTK